MVMRAAPSSAMPRIARCALGDLAEGLGAEACRCVSRPTRRRLDEAGGAQALEVMADERLATGRRGR